MVHFFKTPYICSDPTIKSPFYSPNTCLKPRGATFHTDSFSENAMEDENSSATKSIQ